MASSMKAAVDAAGSSPVPSPWLTVAQAADYAAVSTDTIYFACQRGELRHIRIGGRRSIRLKAEYLDAWMERFVQAERGTAR
jgi:excisionase family DNA binding protein